MSASGFYQEIQQRELTGVRVNFTRHGVVRYGASSVCAAGGHADASDEVAADGGGDGAVILLEPAMNQRNVIFFYLPGGELRSELAMSSVVFGNY